ncbi:MAG: carcinine hydrolase/isopenicillin-N N-acyltransferase family protein [Promethearchaeota archaeon]
MESHKIIFSFTFSLTLIFIFTCFIRSGSACTICTVSSGEKVLFGNNEDWTNPNTYIWFELSNEEKFGGVYLGFDDFFPQGGMNEYGLCFDANALPKMTLNNHPELPYSQKWIVKHILELCANISQVIQVAQEFNWGTSIAYQVQFADMFGDAIVISAGTDGELNFTRKNVGDGFLLSTNFNVGYPKNGWIPCWRYTIAFDMLSDIAQEDNLTVEAIRDILNATHQEGTYATKYSNIFDLITRDIYIYQNFNFKKVVKLNLDKELAKGNENPILISDLFSQTTTKILNKTTQETQTETTQEVPLLFYLSSLIIIFLIRRRFR